MVSDRNPLPVRCQVKINDIDKRGESLIGEAFAPSSSSQTQASPPIDRAPRKCSGVDPRGDSAEESAEKGTCARAKRAK